MRSGKSVLPRGGDRGSPSARLPATAGALDGFIQGLARAVADELEGRLGEQIAEALGAQRSPRLLDRRGLAELLDVSLPTIDRLRKDGCPEILIGDAPRFEAERVLPWLRERGTK